MPEPKIRKRKLPLLTGAILLALAIALTLQHSPWPDRLARTLLLRGLGAAGFEAAVHRVELHAPLGATAYGLALSGEDLTIRAWKATVETCVVDYLRGISPTFIRSVEIDSATIRWQASAPGERGEPGAPAAPAQERDFGKFMPRKFVLHRTDVELDDGQGASLRVRRLHLDGSDRTNGFAGAAAIHFTRDGQEMSFHGVRGITAWRDQVFYLADMRLRDGLHADNLTANLSRLGRGRIGADFSLRIFGGSARVATDYDFASRPARLVVGAWFGRIQLSPFGPWVGDPELAGEVHELRFNFRGHPEQWRRAAAMVRLEAGAIRWKGREIDSISASVVLADGWLEVHKFDLAQGGNSLHLEGETDLAEAPKEWLRGRFRFAVSGTLESPGTLASLVSPPLESLSGTLSIQGDASGRDGDLSGHLTASYAEPAFGGVTADKASVTLELKGNEVRLLGLQVEAGEDYLTASGLVDITGENRYSAELDLTASDLARYLPLLPEALADRVAGGGLTLRWNGDGTRSQHTGAFKTALETIRFTDPSTPPLQSAIEASYSPESLIVRKFEVVQNATRLEMVAVADETGLHLGPMRLTRGDAEWASGEARLPFSWRKALASGLLAGLDPDGETSITLHSDGLDLRELSKLAGTPWPVDGHLDMRVAVGGTPKHPEITAELSGTGLAYHADDHVFEAAGATFSARHEEGQTALAGALRLAPEKRIDFSGRLPLDLAALWDGEQQWFSPEQPLDLSLAMPPTDLAIFTAFLPEAPRKIGGQIEGSLVASGTFGAPRVTGDLQIRDGVFQYSDKAPLLDRVNGTIQFADDVARVGPIRGRAAAGPFEIGGEIKMEGTDIAHLDLTLRGERLLLHRSPTVRVRANADLAARGPLDSVEVTGEIQFVDGRFYRDLEINLFHRDPIRLDDGRRVASFPRLFQFPDPPLAGWTFDVHVRNATPFVLEGNIASGELTPDLFLRGTGAAPFLVGEVQVRDAVASLPFSQLKFERAAIYFDEENPDNPMLDVRAVSNLRGYRVNANIYGRLKNREILLQSDPPLPQESITRLLTTGLVPEELGGGRLERAALGRGGLLLLQSLVRRVGVEDEDVLDRITVNILPPSSRSGGEIIESELELTDNLSLQAERDDWGYFNGGIIYTWRFR